LEEKRLLYTPKDPVTKAIDYLLNHWEFFIEYTNHGKLGILDNNGAERKVRPIMIFRKNAMFFGSAERSSDSALMLSLVENRKLHDVNLMDYINVVLKRIDTYPKDHVDELRPHKWEAPEENVPNITT
jgi:transposase